VPNVLPPAVVLQPVVSNQTTPLLLTARLVGPAGVVITQVPLGAAGVVAGATEGVHPLSVTVTRTDLASWTTTRQSGAVNPLARIRNLPSWLARTPAAEVVELALMKLGAAPVQVRRRPLTSADVR
jgi:hypothetical protein